MNLSRRQTPLMHEFVMTHPDPIEMCSGRWGPAPAEPPLRNWPDMSAATSFPVSLLYSAC